MMIFVKIVQYSSHPSINLLGGISLLNRIVGWSLITIRMLIFFMFFRAAYRLRPCECGIEHVPQAIELVNYYAQDEWENYKIIIQQL